MHQIPPHIEKKLAQAQKSGTFRSLKDKTHLIDFCSNDYLGLARSRFFQQLVNENLKHYLEEFDVKNVNGSSGARLITGQHRFVDALERQIAGFHLGEDALLFNSGYDANVGLLAALPGKNDLIIYDEYIHASVHDGIKMSKADAVSFKHNDVEAAAEIIAQSKQNYASVYLVLESIYSMDGDTAKLKKFCALKEKNEHLFIILDEAHAGGVVGERGEGLAAKLNLQDAILARIFTYGKAFGAHGAAVVVPTILKSFLVNFSRSFIYTTSASFHAKMNIKTAYDIMSVINNRRLKIRNLSKLFKASLKEFSVHLSNEENSPIQGVILPEKNAVFVLSTELEKAGFYAKGIVFPTVPRGKERVRICFHYFNTKNQVLKISEIISSFLKAHSNVNK